MFKNWLKDHLRVGKTFNIFHGMNLLSLLSHSIDTEAFTLNRLVTHRSRVSRQCTFMSKFLAATSALRRSTSAISIPSNWRNEKAVSSGQEKVSCRTTGMEMKQPS